jgi:hypothetical protein
MGAIPHHRSEVEQGSPQRRELPNPMLSLRTRGQMDVVTYGKRDRG